MASFSTGVYFRNACLLDNGGGDYACKERGNDKTYRLLNAKETQVVMYSWSVAQGLQEPNVNWPKITQNVIMETHEVRFIWYQ